jgi:hypothetical protein
MVLKCKKRRRRCHSISFALFNVKKMRTEEKIILWERKVIARKREQNI